MTFEDWLQAHGVSQQTDFESGMPYWTYGGYRVDPSKLDLLRTQFGGAEGDWGSQGALFPQFGDQEQGNFTGGESAFVTIDGKQYKRVGVSPDELKRQLGAQPDRITGSIPNINGKYDPQYGWVIDMPSAAAIDSIVPDEYANDHGLIGNFLDAGGGPLLLGAAAGAMIGGAGGGLAGLADASGGSLAGNPASWNMLAGEIPNGFNFTNTYATTGLSGAAGAADTAGSGLFGTLSNAWDAIPSWLQPSPLSVATSIAQQAASSDGSGNNTAQYEASGLSDLSSRNSATALNGLVKQPSIYDTLVNMAAKTGSTALLMTALGNKNALSNIPMALGGQLLSSIVGGATGLAGNALTSFLKQAGSGIVDAAGNLIGGNTQTADASGLPANYWNMTADGGVWSGSNLTDPTMTDASVGINDNIPGQSLSIGPNGEIVVTATGNDVQSDLANSGVGDTNWLDQFFSSGSLTPTNFGSSPTVNIDTSGIANAVQNIASQTGQSTAQILQGIQAGDSTLLNALTQSMGAIGNQNTQGFNSLNNAVSNVGNQLFGSLSGVQSDLGNLGNFITQGDQNLANMFGQGLNNVNQTLNNGFTDFSKSYNNIEGGLNNLGGLVQQSNQNLQNQIGLDLNNLGSSFTNTVRDSLGGLSNYITQGNQALNNSLGFLNNTFDSGLDSVNQTLNNGFTDFSQSYKDLGNSLLNLQQQNAQSDQQLRDTIGLGFKDLTGDMSQNFNGLSSFLNQGFGTLNNTFDSGLDSVGVGIQNLMQQNQQQALLDAQYQQQDNENASRTYENITNGFNGLGSTFSSALDKLGNTQTLGTLGAAALGYQGALAQIQAQKDIANQYMGIGQPFRDKLLQSYQPGFNLSQSDSGFQGALDQSGQSVLRQLSATGNNNPFGNPGGVAQAQSYVTNNAYIPYLTNYRQGLSNAGGLGLPTAGQASINSANAAGGTYNALGYGLGQLTNPSQDIFNDYIKSQTALNNYRLNDGSRA